MNVKSLSPTFTWTLAKVMTSLSSRQRFLLSTWIDRIDRFLSPSGAAPSSPHQVVLGQVNKCRRARNNAATLLSVSDFASRYRSILTRRENFIVRLNWSRNRENWVLVGQRKKNNWSIDCEVKWSVKSIEDVMKKITFCNACRIFYSTFTFKPGCSVSKDLNIILSLHPYLIQNNSPSHFVAFSNSNAAVSQVLLRCPFIT